MDVCVSKHLNVRIATTLRVTPGGCAYSRSPLRQQCRIMSTATEQEGVTRLGYYFFYVLLIASVPLLLYGVLQ